MTRAALATLAVVALIGAGCSSGSAEKGDTTAAGSTGTTATAATTPREKAVRFAECMRDNGVSEFPDPDASGALTIDGVLNGSSLDPDAPAWKAAVAACKDLQPPGFTGPGKRSSGEQEAALAFAQCIRDNGVEDFPDPVNGEPLVNTNLIPSTSREGGMAVLNAAMEACGEQARDAMEGR